MRLSRATILLATAALLLYGAVLAAKSQLEDGLSRSSRVANPVYPEMLRVARPLGLDVTFAEQVKSGRFDVRDNEVFNNVPSGGWDVIVLGDSALAWSFSAELVRQASGKRVAFLAQTNAMANQKLFDLARRLGRGYLKPGGDLVFLFSASDWMRPPEAQQVTEDLRVLTEASAGVPGARGIRALRQDLRWAAWRISHHLRLPDFLFYTGHIESLVAPRYSAQKKAAAFGAGCTEFQWHTGGGSVFYVCGKGSTAAGIGRIATNAVLDLRDQPGLSDKSAPEAMAAMKQNIRRLAEIRGFGKTIAIPFAVDSAAMWPFRCIPPELLRSADAALLDLPRLARAQLGDIEYEFEGGPHLANASSVLSSYVLGRALRDPGALGAAP